ncbi:MAG: outer membrane beta-barrel protein [Salinibacter sp.]
MRRTAAVFLILVPFLIGATAGAQPVVTMRGNVGAAFFRSPEGLNTVLNSGIDLGLGTGIQLYEGLEIVLEGSYDRFTLNADNIALYSENLSVGTRVEGGALNVLNATIGFRYLFSHQGSARPYAAGGIGIYRSVLERARIPETNQRLSRLAAISRGYHAALGARFRIDDTYSFFFEPRYVIVDTNGTELDTNSSTRYLTVRLGLDVRL